MAAPTLAQRKDEYLGYWAAMKVKPERVASVAASARKLLAVRARYEYVSSKTGVPWFMIAAIHMREASGNFAGVLHNGEKIIGTGRKTKLVPAGRGPFSTWEEAAIDALKQAPHSLHLVKDWSIERILYETERYNGWGYWNRGDKSSAYLWAGSQIDKGGKYVADHVWSSSAQDQQNGAALVMKQLMELAGISKIDRPVTVPSVATPVAPTAPIAKPAADPHKAVGGLLNAIYVAVQSFLKRKS